MCSFGDASINHSDALAGIQRRRLRVPPGKLPLPILFVCEDNRLGISVRDPRGAGSRATFERRLELRLLPRRRPRPGAGLRRGDARDRDLPTPPASRRSCTCARVRLLGPRRQRRRDELPTARARSRPIEARDPLLANARLLVESGAASPEELLAMLRGDPRARVAAAARGSVRRPKLDNRGRGRSRRWPRSDPDAVRRRGVGATTGPRRARAEVFGGRALPEADKPRHSRRSIGRAASTPRSPTR